MLQKILQRGQHRQLAYLLCWVVGSAGCATLAPFGSDLGQQEIDGQAVRPNYVSLLNYFGYIVPGAEPDELRHGEKMFDVYMWLPVVTPELGVRVVSPVKGLQKPQEGDFVDVAYLAHQDSGIYFDTWIQVDRCLAAINPEDVAKPCDQWVALGENDDTPELPAQPDGGKHNSLLRLTSGNDDPLKVLVRGLYRISLANLKVGDPQGTFLLQVGAPVELSGAVITRTMADLAKRVAPGQEALKSMGEIH